MQLVLFDYYGPTLPTICEAPDRYEGSGIPGDPSFGHLCDRNVSDLNRIVTKAFPNKPFYGLTEVEGEMTRLVRRNIVSDAGKGQFIVTEHQFNEIRKFLNIAPNRYGMKNYQVGRNGHGEMLNKFHFWLLDGSREWTEDLTDDQANKYKRVHWVSASKARFLNLI